MLPLRLSVELWEMKPRGRIPALAQQLHPVRSEALRAAPEPSRLKGLGVERAKHWQYVVLPAGGIEAVQDARDPHEIVIESSV